MEEAMNDPKASLNEGALPTVAEGSNGVQYMPEWLQKRINKIIVRRANRHD